MEKKVHLKRHRNLLLYALLSTLILGIVENSFSIIFAPNIILYYLITFFLWFILSIIFWFISILVPRLLINYAADNFGQLLLLTLPSFFYLILGITSIIPGNIFNFLTLSFSLICLTFFISFWIFIFKKYSLSNFNISRWNYVFVATFLNLLIISWFMLYVAEMPNDFYLIIINSLLSVAFYFATLYFSISYLRKNLNLNKRLIKITYLIISLALIVLFSDEIHEVFYHQDLKHLVEYHSDDKKYPNVILIVMDAARRKNMSVYGYEDETSPNLKKLCSEGVLFTKAIASSSWSLPTHVSLFTGLPPSIHNVDEDGESINNVKGILTIAELLKINGYKTGAFIGNLFYLNKFYGFNRGFDYFLNIRSKRAIFIWDKILRYFSKSYFIRRYIIQRQEISGDDINKKLKRFLKKNKNHKMFIFINYMETHGACYLDKKYLNRFGINNIVSNVNPILKKEIKNDDNKQLVAWYNAEINYVDEKIGEIIDYLRQEDMFDKTMIIVTSDHGELLGEYGEYRHGNWLFNELLEIPLIIKYPENKDKGTIRGEIIQHDDIMREILKETMIEEPMYIKRLKEKDEKKVAVSELKKTRYWIKKDKKYDRELIAIYSRKYPGHKLILSSTGEKKLYIVKGDKEEESMNNQEKIKEIENEYIEYLREIEEIKKYFKYERRIEKIKSLGYLGGK